MPRKQLKTTIKNFIQMAYQFMTIPTFPNPYVSHTVNNIDLIVTLNNKRKD